jgi:hypothetical protein
MMTATRKHFPVFASPERAFGVSLAPRFALS